MNTSPGTSQFSLVQSDFPKEFAMFVNFIGGNELTDASYRVVKKMASYSLPVRSTFGDRFYFHEQWARFVAAGFQLDVRDTIAIRAASLIAGVNRIHRGLSAAASARFRKNIIGILRPDRDIRQLEHEISCYTHFGQKGFDVTFADLEGIGEFDLLLTDSPTNIEVECKTVSEDTGSQIKRQMAADLFEIFKKATDVRVPVHESGIFMLTLRKSSKRGHSITSDLRRILAGKCDKKMETTEDFVLTFIPRPTWAHLLQTVKMKEVQQAVSSDPELVGFDHFIAKVSGSIVSLSLRPHRPSQFRERIIDVLKAAAGQCSGTRASVLWLHFVGAAPADFLELAKFSIAGKGEGLNAVTCDVVHPGATRTDRSHVHTVRFSATSSEIISTPALTPNRLLTRAASVGGPCYDVPNPFCRYPLTTSL